MVIGSYLVRPSPFKMTALPPSLYSTTSDERLIAVTFDTAATGVLLAPKYTRNLYDLYGSNRLVLTGKMTPLQDLGKPNGFVPIVGVDSLVASGVAPPYFRDVRYRKVPMRLYTMRLSSATDGLVRTARPLTEANATIARVRWLLIALTLGGALAAALLGWLAASAVLRPVRALAGTVRKVTATRDLKQRIPVSGRDEVASLAAGA